MSSHPKPTDEQKKFAGHPREAIVMACPGAGKTRTILDRIEILFKTLPPRRGIAVLSFTQSAVEEFADRCRERDLLRISAHPSFLGTFDSFIRHFLVMPGGICTSSGVIRPIIVESWDSLGIRVRIRNGSAGAGISLDRFCANDNSIDPERIGHTGERTDVQNNRQKYERSAANMRASLRNKGWLSAADARKEALDRINNKITGSALSRAIAARFEEIIVDEGQDCNPEDIEVLQWLRKCGIRVTVLSDPDQAIYGFRHGASANLWEFANAYEKDDRLQLTGNFRCSPVVCSFAATLRGQAQSKPDASLGCSKPCTIPVKILIHERLDAPASAGKKFEELLTTHSIERENAAILAHDWKSARRVAGDINTSSDAGSSNIERVARAVSIYNDHASVPRDRLSALKDMERLILKLENKCASNEPLESAIQHRKLDRRILRRKAVSLISTLPYPIGRDDGESEKWVRQVQSKISDLEIAIPDKSTVAKCFPNRSTAKWSHLLHRRESSPIIASSIHEAKGREYNAVCLVLSNRRDRIEEMFSAWESRSEHEAKRVIYVGATRAERLLAVVIPGEFASRLTAILQASAVAFDPPVLLSSESHRSGKKKAKSQRISNQDGLFD